MFVRAYLRASTVEQDASRARAALDAFAAERGLSIASRYVENESGAKLARPELSRLTEADWRQLRAEIDAKQVRVVALDLPTSWSLTAPPDAFTGRMFAAVNAMMLDVLAAVARKDYDDRRRRQAEGTAKARASGLYKGRRENKARNDGIAAMLRAGSSWQQIQDATGCSRGTVAKVRKRLDVAPVTGAG